jgi:hypothetical protein
VYSCIVSIFTMQLYLEAPTCNAEMLLLFKPITGHVVLGQHLYRLWKNK